MAHRMFYHELPVDRIVTIPDLKTDKHGRNRSFDADRLANIIRSTDLFISLAPWNTPSVEALISGLQPQRTIGFHDFYDIRLPQDDSIHSADLAFTAPHLLDPTLIIEDFAWPFKLPHAATLEAKRIRQQLPPRSRVLAVHTDTSPEKCWPAPRFSQCLDTFLARHDEWFVWILGLTSELQQSGRYSQRIASLHDTALDLQLALVAHADAFVGIDSCMMHAADLCGVPGVGIFGPTRTCEWGFRFGPHRHVCGDGTMDTVAVDAVLDAIDQLLTEKTSRRRD
jgi:ADP-heptose:LPS heptosyltransferase